MKLVAIKEGIYGFKLTSSLHEALKAGEGLFVFLESLILGQDLDKPILSVSCPYGGYVIDVYENVESNKEIIESFERIFLNCQGYISCETDKTFSVCLGDELSLNLYGALHQILLLSKLNSTSYACVGMDESENPVKIYLEVENSTIS